jgi:hypothetical protein
MPPYLIYDFGFTHFYQKEKWGLPTFSQLHYNPKNCCYYTCVRVVCQFSDTALDRCFTSNRSSLIYQPSRYFFHSMQSASRK